MAGLVPAIHALPRSTKSVDARDKPGHDDLLNVCDCLPQAGEGAHLLRSRTRTKLIPPGLSVSRLQFAEALPALAVEAHELHLVDRNVITPGRGLAGGTGARPYSGGHGSTPTSWRSFTSVPRLRRRISSFTPDCQGYPLARADRAGSRAGSSIAQPGNRSVVGDASFRAVGWFASVENTQSRFVR